MNRKCINNNHVSRRNRMIASALILMLVFYFLALGGHNHLDEGAATCRSYAIFSCERITSSLHSHSSDINLTCHSDSCPLCELLSLEGSKLFTPVIVPIISGITFDNFPVSPDRVCRQICFSATNPRAPPQTSIV